MWAAAATRETGAQAPPLTSKGRGGKSSGVGKRRATTKREAMMGTAVDLFASILADGEAGLARPDSWCFTSVVDALVRGGR